MSFEDDMRQAIERHFTFATGVAVDAGRGEPPLLFPEELRAVESAVESRQREFAFGRACARGAMLKVGVRRQAIPRRPDRAPQWPTGVVGSITHCDGLVAAVVTVASAVRGLGLDAEPATGLERDIERMVLADGEDLQALDWIDEPLRTKAVFAAKEAVHKCIHPVHGVMLDFRDVRLLSESADRFRVEPVTATARDLDGLASISGRVTLNHGFLIASAAIVD